MKTKGPYPSPPTKEEIERERLRPVFPPSPRFRGKNPDSKWTHLPLLTRYVAITQGPVLELGCGVFSTTVLHEMCVGTGRLLVSVEVSPSFYEMFEPLRCPLHEIVLIKKDEWLEWDGLTSRHWSVVLVDQVPDTSRAPCIEKLKGHARYIVAHNSEQPYYRYEPVFRRFRYRRDYTFLRPCTTVVSDEVPV